MILAILVAGGVVTALSLVNALLSFKDEGPTWASWFRLQFTVLPVMATALLLNIALLFGLT